MKNNLFKKSLAIVMTVMMLMTSWVFIPGVFTEAEATATDTTYRVAADQYGTPYWSPNSNNVRWMQWGSSRDSSQAHVYIEVPKTIYLDVSETLESAGYKIFVEWSLGDSTSYRWGLGPAAWGNGNGISGQSGTEQFTMNNMFASYSVDASLHGGENVYGENGYDKTDKYDLRIGDNYSGSSGFIVFKNTGSKNNWNNNIYLKGTPNKAGSGRYSTTGINPSPFNFTQQWTWKQKWEEKTSPLNATGKPDSVSEQLYGYNEVWWDVEVYDKGALKNAADNALTVYNNNIAYNAYVVDNGLAKLDTLITEGQNMLRVREQTSKAVSDKTTAINNAAKGLEFKANNATLISKVAEAEAIQNKAGYSTLYTAESRQALQVAVNNAKSNTLYSSVTTYKVETYSDAGKRASDEQTTINNLTNAVNTAINCLVRKYDVGYDNLFSITDWAVSTSATVNGGTLEFDADTGTISVTDDASVSGTDTYTTDGANGMYVVKVKANTEYVFSYDAETTESGNVVRPLIFDTNASLNGYEAVIKDFASNNGKQAIYFTTPNNDVDSDGYTYIHFRFGVVGVEGGKAIYKNIGLFEKSVYDDYAKDYNYVRTAFLAGEVKDLVAPSVPKEGYTFDGWKLADGTKITSTEGLDASTMVYATWTKKWSVVFLDAEGGEYYRTTVKDGEAAAKPALDPTKASDDVNSYSFVNWDVDFSNVTSDITVTPVFQPTAHNFVWSDSTSKDATCTAPAKVVKYCENCGYDLDPVDYDGDNKDWLALGHNFEEGSPVTGSSTGVDGTHKVKCIRCDATEDKPHSYVAYKTEGATCSVKGTVYKRCACLQETTSEGEFAPDVHKNTRLINVETPTCEEDGYTGDTYCDDCKKTVANGKVDPKLGHSFTNYVSNGDATCETDGTKTAKCERCDATDTIDDTGSALGHVWENTKTYLKTSADCVTDAVYYKECSRCNVSSETKTGDTWTDAGSKWNHKFDGDYVDNNNGTHNRKCTNEGCTATGATDDCTYGEWSKTEADTHTKTCSECGYSVTEDHSWSKWTTVDGATADAAAQHTHSCTVCGRTETTDCTYTSVETKVTCTTDGYTTHTCDICKHVYVTPGTTATGHVYTGAVQSLNNGTHNYLCKNGCGTYGYETVENAFADCDYKYENDAADGEHQAICKECNYSFAEKCSGGTATCTAAAVCEKCNEAYGETVPHSFNGEAVQLEGDFHAYLCKFCGDTTGIKGVGTNVDGKESCSGGTATCSAKAECTVCGDDHGEFDADAHKWGTWTNNEGTETHTRVCEYNSDHTESDNCFGTSPAVASPDCNTAGFTLNTCEECGHTWKTDPQPALGHKWGAWVNNGDGTHTRTCERNCGYADNTDTKSCTKENADAVVKAPTCTEGGYTTYTCKDCGYVWTADATEATGHSYAAQKKKTDSKYLRTTKSCTSDLTYWYRCDNCDVSAGTEVEKYENEADLYWVSETRLGHKYENIVKPEYLKDAATCTTKATYYYSCSNCGASSKDTADERTFESGAALGHEWTDTETFKKSAADCINNEVYYKECSRCHISSENETGATWTKANTLTGHDFDHDDDGVIGNEGDAGYTAGVAAECEKTGMQEHYTCQTCGKHFKADKTTEIAADKLVIAALKHDFKDVSAKAATCEEDGYTKHKQCQREGCGYRNTDYKVVPAKGHDFKAENGYYCDTGYNYHAYYCSRYDNCGAYGVDNVKYSVDATGLDPVIVGGIKCDFTGEYVNYEDANGVHSHKLTCVCGNVSSDVCVDAEPVHVAPTCEEDGYYVHTCDVCEFVWNVASDAEEDKALTHDLKVVANGNGTHSAQCQREGCDYKERVEKCSTVTPATKCGSYDICDKCKTEFGEAKPHVFTNYVSDNNAKCNQDGTKTAVCDTCEGEDKATDTVRDYGSALKHEMSEYSYSTEGWKYIPEDFSEIIAEPKCNAEGLSISYCENCSYYVTKIIPKNENHSYSDWQNMGGSCATGITYKQVCEFCGDTKTKVEHDVEHEFERQMYKAPTCTEGSIELKVCKNCGFSEEVRDELPAKGHTWGEAVIDKAATCKNTGRMHYICQICGAKSESETIAKVLHAWDQNDDGIIDEGFTPDAADNSYIYVEATNATCSADGYEGYFKCLDCSYDQHLDERWLNITGNFKPATGHVDNDGDGECDGKGCNKDLSGDSSKGCGCICHKTNWFSQIIYKILRFFWKLFGIGKSCDCGKVHY